MMEESNDPKLLRAEINKIIANIEDRDTLLFLLWAFNRILRNQPLPPLEDTKSLCDAFLRVMKAIRMGTKARKTDLYLVARWMTDHAIRT